MSESYDFAYLDIVFSQDVCIASFSKKQLGSSQGHDKTFGVRCSKRPRFRKKLVQPITVRVGSMAANFLNTQCKRVVEVFMLWKCCVIRIFTRLHIGIV